MNDEPLPIYEVRDCEKVIEEMEAQRQSQYSSLLPDTFETYDCNEVLLHAIGCDFKLSEERMSEELNFTVGLANINHQDLRKMRKERKHSNEQHIGSLLMPEDTNEINA